MSIGIWSVGLVFLFSPFVWSYERIGTFSIEEVRLRATWLNVEDDGSDFSLSDSSFSLRWRRDKRISAFVAVGSELSRNQPVYYATMPEDRLGFYEAYAEYDGVYGRIRFGLIPLQFGYDGVLSSSERYFQRALPYTERIIGLRDQGLSFYTEHNGYYTQLAVHNGEVDAPSDGRPWISGNWGFSNKRHFRTQLSIQTGDVRGEVSSGASNTIAGVVNGETAHWRNGLFFMHWYPRRWNIVVQMGGGEVQQGDREGRYNTNMIELTRYFSKGFGLGLRYDQLDPDRKTDGDMRTEASLVAVLKSDDSTSSLYLLGTKVIEEAHERPNDQLRLVWLLTPFSR